MEKRMSEKLESKRYLLDTSIILDDIANIIYLWQGGQNELFISDVVIEELDAKKDLSNENGYFAREFFRCINTESSLDSNAKAIEGIESSDFVRDIEFKKDNFFIPLKLIYREHYKTPQTLKSYNDSKLIEIAKDYGLVLLTNDISLKVRTQAQGLDSQSLFRDRVENPNDIDFWHRFEVHKDTSLSNLSVDSAFSALPQWSLIEIDEMDNTDSAMYKTGKKIFGLKVGSEFVELNLDEILKQHEPYILPINLEQKMLYALLLHPQNKLTIATGSTGSGKTLIALQAGLSLVKSGVVDGIVYMRNTITANDKEAELGFRKGDESQKLGYFMYPLYSAINFTIDRLQQSSLAKRIEYRGDVSGIEKKDATEYFLQKHNIQIVDIAHARGISIGNKFVIFDEVQNASNATIKLIGTRIGEGSRIVFLGDWAQIDHPYLSKFRNGALSLLSKARENDFIAGIQLRQTIRSDVASWFGENF